MTPRCGQDRLLFDLMLDQSQEVCARLLQRLTALNARFPSPELVEAINLVEAARSRLEERPANPDH